MIRKAIIVLLTLGAVVTVVAFVFSAEFGVGYFGDAFGVLLADGLLAIAYGAPDDITGGFFQTKDPQFSELPLIWLPKSLHNPAKNVHGVGVPLWMIFLAFAAYPTLAFMRGPVLRQRRRRKGLCFACGYDLTGNVSGVCPECGEGYRGAGHV